jgi:hypothetical protein
MNKFFLSKEEIRCELIVLGNKYLNPKDMNEIISIFDANTSGKHILYILSTRKKISFEEEDQEKLRVLAHNLGV